MKMDNRNWVTHAEWVVVFLTLLGGFYMVEMRLDSINSRFDQFLVAWHEEAKDFHGRLCSIEERNKSK
jgi:hypothetical protein